MFIIHGQRKLRIRKYEDSETVCPNCRSLGLDISVFKKYFHLFFIPFFPVGVKSSSIYCTKCNNDIRIDSLQSQYEKSARAPVYFYSGLILIGCLILFLVYSNIQTQKQKREFVESPRVGDVYSVVQRNGGDSAEHFFLRISRIKGDSVFTYHSNLIYSRYTYKFVEDDFFVKDEELLFLRPELRKMLDEDEISAVERGYDNSRGFNKIR